jgi:hypothetical protein
MLRIDVPSAAATLPAPTAAGTPGYFTDGDPAGGQEATILPAEFMNALMMEVINVIVAASIAPSKAVNTQLRDAIGALIANAITATLSASGHVEFPVGDQFLIVNWGNGTHADGSGVQAVTFEQPFAAGHFCSIATNRSTGIPAAVHATGDYTLTGMNVRSAALTTGAAAGSGTTFNWIAIGR